MLVCSEAQMLYERKIWESTAPPLPQPPKKQVHHPTNQFDEVCILSSFLNPKDFDDYFYTSCFDLPDLTADSIRSAYN